MNNLKKKVIIFGCFFVALILSFILGRLQVINSYKLVSIPYANDYLEARTLIKNKDISYTKVPSSLINDEMILEEGDIIGKYVSASSFINEGSFFFRSNIEDISDMKDASFFEINEGETVYELFIKNIDVNAAHINNNMYVDLYLTLEKPVIMSDLLLSGAKVCGLYNNNYEDVNKSDDKRNNLAIISLVVDENMISILNKAQLVGKLSIVPSNNPYEYRDMYVNKEGEIMNYLN